MASGVVLRKPISLATVEYSKLSACRPEVSPKGLKALAAAEFYDKGFIGFDIIYLSFNTFIPTF